MEIAVHDDLRLCEGPIGQVCHGLVEHLGLIGREGLAQVGLDIPGLE